MFIHSLETNTDPAGTNCCSDLPTRKRRVALARLVRELQAERSVLIDAARELMPHIDKLAKPKTDFGRATRKLRDAIVKAED